MKTLALLLLLAVAVAYYFGYEPYDLIPSWPASNTPPPKVRRAQAPAPEQAPAAAPQRTGGSVVIAEGPDGTLEHRWQKFPAPSPARP